MAEMSGQMGFMYFLVGFIILLLFILIGRVSALTRTVNGLKKSIKNAEANILSRNSVQGSAQAGNTTVPNAVIAAISAAVNMYRSENK